MPTTLNRIGQVFGRLTIVSLNTPSRSERTPEGKRKRYRATYNCLCNCGREKVGANIRMLQDGSIKSCGCLAADIQEQHMLRREQGTRDTPSYALTTGKGNFLSVWDGVKERCYNKNNHSYPRYGGRGIKMCDLWKHSYREFALAVGPRPSLQHSIDRIDTNGNYESGNIKWSTDKQQSNNRRTNIFIQWKGERLTLTQLAEKEQVNYSYLHTLTRVRCFPVEEAMKRAKASKRKFDPRTRCRAKYHSVMPAFQKQNLTGQTFGYWTVLRENKEEHASRQRVSDAIIPSLWVCQCVCGRINPAVRVHSLLGGKSCSCGCKRKQPPPPPPETEDWI